MPGLISPGLEGWWRRSGRDPKYEGRHRADRDRLAPLVRGGSYRCARGEACVYAELVEGVAVGGLIHPGEAWDLGHADGESVGGPEHAACNRRAGALKRKRGRMRHSRVW